MKRKHYFIVCIPFLLILIFAIIYTLEDSKQKDMIEGGDDHLYYFSGKVLDYDSEKNIITVEVDDDRDRMKYDTVRLNLDYCVSDSKIAEELKEGDKIDFSFISNQFSNEEIIINSFEPRKE